MSKFIGFLLVLAVLAGVVYFAFFKEGSGPGGAHGGIPITLKHADGVGALRIQLSYEPSTAAVRKVQSGDLARNALIESNLDVPGRIVIGVVDVEGLKGDGAVAIVQFEPGKGPDPRALVVTSIEAYDAETRHELAPSIEGGGERGPLIRFGKD